MPTTGAYEFRIARAAKDGLVENENLILKGEWTWIDRGEDGEPRWLLVYMRCPDCGHLITLWRKRGEGEAEGHQIDAQGNISPSVLHSYPVNGVEQCGFHTQPTKLLDFVDKR